MGDVEAEQFERNIHVVHDDELTAYANQVASRVAAHLPPSDLKIRVMLVDLPIVNAFSLAGGRIYVTRKAVAFLQNEHELAGLLGHEMGHALTHQQAIDITRMFRDVIGVTSVGDRKDIFDKFNHFLDNIGRNPRSLEQTGKEEEPHQYEADQVALYAVAQAGYSAESFVTFFDRLAQTQGRTGNWLGDFLGMTKPNEKRLRQLRKTFEDLPQACRTAAAAPSDVFFKWQANVIAFSDLGREERLAGLIESRPLEPPLRTDVTQLKFSPDGNYLLAQDEASIFLYTRKPLELLMRIDAPDAHRAQFTPDSKGMVFDTRGMRVERWNIPEEKRVDIHELAVPRGCLQTLLSHDGQTLACIDEDLGLSLFDVASGKTTFGKKECFKPEDPLSAVRLFFTLLLMGTNTKDPEIVHMVFSPDDHYFLGGLFARTLMVNTASHSTEPLRGGLPGVVGGGLSFLTLDLVIGVNRDRAGDSGIFQFPSGKLEQRFPMDPQHIEAPTRANNLMIVKPLKDARAGVVDLKTRNILFLLDFSAAVDVYDQTFAIEKRSGDLALYDVATRRVTAETALPRSPLGELQTWAASSDLKWLAASGETRGAVWDTTNSKRMYFLRGFHGGWFDGNVFFADFPKLEKVDRAIVRVSLDRTNMAPSTTLTEETLTRQYGPYLLVQIPEDKTGLMFRNLRIEVHDVRDNHVLWTRNFPKAAPKISMNHSGDTIVLEWPADQNEAQEEIKSDAGLKAKYESIRDRKSAFLLEVLDSATGKMIGHLLVDTGKGSFRVESVSAEQNWVLVSDTSNRIHVYSLASGAEEGVVFGSSAFLCPSKKLLAVENEPGKLDIYTLPNLERRDPLVFRSPISVGAFSADGKRLLVLTANQVAYLVDTAAVEKAGQAVAAQ